MDKAGALAALFVAIVITAILVVPALLMIWVYEQFGFSWQVAVTVVTLLFLIAFSWVLSNVAE